MMKCFKCASRRLVKNGRVFGRQRYKCKECGYQFTKSAPAGKPLFIKMAVHDLYMFGLSMRAIAAVVGVSAQSVSRWIRKWHPAYLSEVGEKQDFFKMPAHQLMRRLNIPPEAELLTSGMALPSGAKCHLVIELPVAAAGEKPQPSPSVLKKSLRK